MEVTVQWVRTKWSKQSRGGAGAARRNAVPVAFALPELSPPVVHEVVLDERDEFEPRSSVVRSEPDVGDVLLREADGLLRVVLVVTPFGMPRRRRRPPAVRLGRGEWLRWQVNYRFTSGSGGDWTYRLDTLNLSYGSTDATGFLGVPNYYVDERGHLR